MANQNPIYFPSYMVNSQSQPIYNAMTSSPATEYGSFYPKNNFVQNQSPIFPQQHQQNTQPQLYQSIENQSSSDLQQAQQQGYPNAQQGNTQPKAQEFLQNPSLIADTDLNSSLFQVGQSIGFSPDKYGLKGANAEDAKKGNTARLIGSVGKSGLNIARVIVGGVANGNRNAYANKEYLANQYKANSGEHLFSFENGGEATDLAYGMTGAYTTGLPEGSQAVPNAELEGDEYIQTPDGEVQKVVGKSHEQGGEKMHLEMNTTVLSDNLKPKDLGEFGIEPKKSDTYASILDKYSKKIGLTKLLDKQATYNDKLLELKDVKDDGTANLNRQYLSEQINNLEQEMTPLKEKQGQFYNYLYEHQENSKKKRTDKATNAVNTIFKNGGSLTERRFAALCKKYKISEDEGQKMLIHIYANGGKQEVNTSIFTDQAYKANELSPEQREQVLDYYTKYVSPDFRKQVEDGTIDFNSLIFNPDLVSAITSGEAINTNNQHASGSNYGGVDDDRLAGFVLNDYFKTNYGSEFGTADGADVGKLQEEYNKDFKKEFGVAYNSAVSDSQASDEKRGNRTLSYLRRIRDVEGTKAGQIDVDKLIALSKEKDGVEMANEMLEDYGLTFDDIKGYANSVNKYINITPAQDVAEQVGDGVVTPPKGTTPPEQPENIVDQVTPRNPEQNRRGAYYFPSQAVLPPSGVTPHLMTVRDYEELDPIKTTIEPNLVESYRAQNTANSSLNNRPDSIRTAGIAAVNADTQNALNNTIVQNTLGNAQRAQQADTVNTQTYNTYDAQRANDLLNYEQRQLTAVDKTEQNIRNYFKYNSDVRLNNFKTANQLQRIDNLSENFKVDPFGQTVFDQSVASNLTPQQWIGLLNTQRAVGQVQSQQ